jgi:hypothetical protein
MPKIIILLMFTLLGGCESAQILYRCNGDKICRCVECESTDCAFSKNCQCGEQK